ncbi:MAG TPA: TRAP transporter small permease [Burkholderiales bacterium]
MRRFLDRLYAAAAVVAAVALVAIFVLMIAQAAGREAGVLIRGADDVVAWLCAACAFLALGHTFRHGDLVRVGVFLDRLGARARWIAELTALSITAAFGGYMLWAVAGFVYESWELQEPAQGLLPIPIWIPQTSLVIGIAIFLVALVDELVAVLRGRKPAYREMEEARAAAADFSETV